MIRETGRRRLMLPSLTKSVWLVMQPNTRSPGTPLTLSLVISCACSLFLFLSFYFPFSICNFGKENKEKIGLTTPKSLGGMTSPSVLEGGSATPACFGVAALKINVMDGSKLSYFFFLIVFLRNLFYIL
jgi:hypothetical protein